jgi:hypothetical protein
MQRCMFLVSCLMVAACSSFHEQHYFQSVNSDTGKPVNYFRVTVTGQSLWTRSRYVSGYYDERAVDLFFNEIKTPASGDVKPIFEQDQLNPGTADKIVSLAPNQNGAFLMIFSTNAKAVSDAIGQFAESQVVADSLTRLMNRSEIRDLRRRSAGETASTARMQAVSSELAALMTELPDTADKTTAQGQSMRVLQAIAVSLGGDGNFGSRAEAAAWFSSRAVTEKEAQP